MNTRDTLLDVAEALARTRGIDAFSFADLATAVGIKKPSVHHHFPTKSDLAHALILRYCDDFFKRLDSSSRNLTRAGDKLLEYLKQYREALGNDGKICLCVAFSAVRDNLGADVISVVNQFHLDSQDWLLAVFKAGQADGSIRAINATEQDAISCLALVEGAQLLARASSNPEMFDRAVLGMRSRIVLAG